MEQEQFRYLMEIFNLMQTNPVAGITQLGIYLSTSYGSGFVAYMFFNKLRELYPMPTSITSVGKNKWIFKNNYLFYKFLWVPKYAFVHVSILSAYMCILGSLMLSVLYKDVNIFINILTAIILNQGIYKWHKYAESRMKIKKVN